MEGFEQFDVRAWVSNGVTRHLVIPAAKAARHVAKAGSKVVAQVTIASILTAGATLQVASNATAAVLPQASTSSLSIDRQSMRVPEMGPLVSHFTASALRWHAPDSMPQVYALTAQAERVEVRNPSDLRVGNTEQFGTARERFLTRRPAKMSENTQRIADRLLEKRNQRATEDSAVWAERVMKNIYM